MVTISLLTLANHAEVRDGFLYLCGAEWDTITRTYPAGGAPQPLHLGIAVTVVVPWTEIEQTHRVEVWIEDEDARRRIMATTADIEVGRPVGKPPGSDTRVPLAISGIIEFPGVGGYRVQAKMGGHRKTYSFRINDNVTAR